MIRRAFLTLLLVFLLSFVSSSAESGYVYRQYTLPVSVYKSATFKNSLSSYKYVDEIERKYIPQIKKSGSIPIKQEGENIPKDLKISFVGDCTLGTDESFSKEGNFPDRLAEHQGNFSYFFEGVKDVFSTDDLTLANLETTFTEAQKKANKKFRFRGKPDYVRILEKGSVEAVNISNNHIRDYLQRGYDDTLRALQSARIGYFGEGNLLMLEIKGIRVICLGFTGWDLSRKEEIIERICEARKQVDILIVSFHWGQERVNYPNSVQKVLGRACIDNGADIVVGHHPHVIQGIEEYKGKCIVYSLGNFCFGGNKNPPDKDTFIFQVLFTMKGGKILKSEFKAIPCSISSSSSINDYRPRVLSGAEGNRVMKRLSQYSAALEYGVSSLSGTGFESDIPFNK